MSEIVSESPAGGRNPNKLLIQAFVIGVSMLATLPHVYFSMGKAFLCSVAISVVLAVTFSMVLFLRGEKSSAVSPERRLFAHWVFAMILAILSVSLAALSIGVFFHFSFWKALCLCVAITLGGAVFFTLASFVFLALNRGFLEKRPIDPDAPR